jgi:hypothetical protein
LPDISALFSSFQPLRPTAPKAQSLFYVRTMVSKPKTVAKSCEVGLSECGFLHQDGVPPHSVYQDLGASPFSLMIVPSILDLFQANRHMVLFHRED